MNDLDATLDSTGTRLRETRECAGFSEGEQAGDLQPDPLVDELRRLASGISVTGGAFTHWLPPPAEVPPEDRDGALRRATRSATGKCLTDLLAEAELPAVQPGHLASGSRDWPSGHVGSVSHKGTRVVAALAPISDLRALGIDIETLDRVEGLSEIDGLVAADELPFGHEDLGPVILFSAKEAVYKALNPLVGWEFGFDEVKVSWARVHSSDMRGTARVEGVAVDIRCSIALPAWVASVAFVSA